MTVATKVFLGFFPVIVEGMFPGSLSCKLSGNQDNTMYSKGNNGAQIAKTGGYKCTTAYTVQGGQNFNEINFNFHIASATDSEAILQQAGLIAQQIIDKSPAATEESITKAVDQTIVDQAMSQAVDQANQARPDAIAETVANTVAQNATAEASRQATTDPIQSELSPLATKVKSLREANKAATAEPKSKTSNPQSTTPSNVAAKPHQKSEFAEVWKSAQTKAKSLNIGEKIENRQFEEVLKDVQAIAAEVAKQVLRILAKKSYFSKKACIRLLKKPRQALRGLAKKVVQRCATGVGLTVENSDAGSTASGTATEHRTKRAIF